MNKDIVKKKCSYWNWLTIHADEVKNTVEYCRVKFCIVCQGCDTAIVQNKLNLSTTSLRLAFTSDGVVVGVVREFTT